MTFEELCEKKKKMEDACTSYKEAVRTFLEQCLEEAGLNNKVVRPKENPELVGKLFIEFYYGSIAIVFRKINKNGSISRNTSYISNFSYTQTFEGYPKLTAKLVKLFEPVGDSE